MFMTGYRFGSLRSTEMEHPAPPSVFPPSILTARDAATPCDCNTSLVEGEGVSWPKSNKSWRGSAGSTGKVAGVRSMASFLPFPGPDGPRRLPDGTALTKYFGTADPKHLVQTGRQRDPFSFHVRCSTIGQGSRHVFHNSRPGHPPRRNRPGVAHTPWGRRCTATAMRR